MSHQPTSLISSCHRSHCFVHLRDADCSSADSASFPQVGAIEGEFREVLLKGRCCDQIMRLPAGAGWQLTGKHVAGNFCLELLIQIPS